MRAITYLTNPGNGVDDCGDEYFAHLYDIAFDGRNDGRLLMLGTAYIDESADGPSAKAFAAVALVAKEPIWKDFRYAWKAQLRKSDLDYFKHSECISCNGEFLKLRDRYKNLHDAKLAALEIRSKFEKIIVESTCRCVGMGIDMADFKKLDARMDVRQNSRWESNHVLVGSTMAIGVVGAILERAHREKPSPYPPIAAFVCDDSQESEHIIRAHRLFKTKFPEYAPHMGSITSDDDKKVFALQAADLMAALARDMFIEWIDGGKRGQPSCRLPDTILGLQCLDEDGMLAILRGDNVQPWITTKEVKKARKDEDQKFWE